MVMRNSHALIALALALSATQVGAQGSPYKTAKVRSCPYADSLLGPMKDDSRGKVRVFHHKEKDSTFLVTGAGDVPMVFLVSMKMAGQRPTRDPDVQVTLYLRGKPEEIRSAVTDPPVVTLVLDDSLVIEPTEVGLGRWEGPKEMPVTLPISALLPVDDITRVATARKIAFRTGPLTLAMSTSERRELRAAIRVAVCPP